MRSRPTIFSIIALVLACASCTQEVDGPGEPDAMPDPENPMCSTAAIAMPVMLNRTIAAMGSVDCDIAASISIDVCMQSDAGGSFADLMCRSTTISGVAEYQAGNMAECTPGPRYRARVRATINDVPQDDVLSPDVACE
jgi:hypothetical protein